MKIEEEFDLPKKICAKCGSLQIISRSYCSECGKLKPEGYFSLSDGIFNASFFAYIVGMAEAFVLFVVLLLVLLLD